MLADGNLTRAATAATEAIAAASSLAYPFPMALCLETAALVVLHDADSRPPASDPAGRVEASGRLLTAATVIRERGDRPGPVTLSAAVTVARRALPPIAAAALDPTAAADLASALLAALTKNNVL